MKVNRITLPETLTEKTALQFIGNIASVCTGNFNKFSPEQCEKIGRKNLTESMGKPTRAWEFLPVDDCYKDSKFANFREFLGGYSCGVADLANLYDLRYHTNREFLIFHLRIPRMVRDHIKTHTTLSSLCESTRLGDPNKEVEYWFPEIEKDDGLCSDRRNLLEDETGGSEMYCYYTGYDITYTLRNFYKRKEIFTRPLSDFVMGDMIIAGYRENWEHFCKVRTDKATQKETRWVAEQIKKLITT